MILSPSGSLKDVKYFSTCHFNALLLLHELFLERM